MSRLHHPGADVDSAGASSVGTAATRADRILIVRCKNHDFIDVEVTASALTIEGRDVTSFVLRDISARKRLVGCCGGIFPGLHFASAGYHLWRYEGLAFVPHCVSR